MRRDFFSFGKTLHIDPQNASLSPTTRPYISRIWLRFVLDGLWARMRTNLRLMRIINV
jgi:hypothetical protein